MKSLKNKFVLTGLFFLTLLSLAVYAYGAKTITGVFSTFDLTAVSGSPTSHCLETSGYVYKSVGVTKVGGTFTGKILFSPDNKGHVYDLKTNITDTYSGEMITAATHICVQITACSSCDLDVQIYAQDQRREADR